MIKPLLFATMLIPSFALADFVVQVKDVYDGDTFKTELALPPPLNKVYIRINGIDTPEKGSRAKCEKEKNLAKEAATRLKELLPINSSVQLTNVTWDKYGGRINAEVIFNNINIGQQMIEDGLAKPYSGEGAKPNWCN